jgi:archaellum biogenesis protein FlaJ (TadC family)
MDWMKIFSAILIVGMVVFIWPRAKYWLKNSPKAKEGDWMGAMVPLAMVVGFVILLIMMV